MCCYTKTSRLKEEVQHNLNIAYTIKWVSCVKQLRTAKSIYTVIKLRAGRPGFIPAGGTFLRHHLQFGRRHLQRVRGARSPCGLRQWHEADSLLASSDEVRNAWRCTAIRLHAITVWRSVGHRENFLRKIELWLVGVTCGWFWRSCTRF
jgi:hypothetical protein